MVWAVPDVHMQVGLGISIASVCDSAPSLLVINWVSPVEISMALVGCGPQPSCADSHSSDGNLDKLSGVDL